MTTDPIPVLVDCDTGIDDAMALLFMLAQDRYEVVGITTVFGNNTAAQCAINSLRILELVGRTDIPVAVGAENPLVGEVTYLATHVHGTDGLGDAGLPVEVRTAPDPRDAVQLIDDLSREHEGRLRILALAPLTNLAHALERIPGLTQRIADVVIMGGAVDAPGNQSPAAEANIIHDPEAGQAVLTADWATTLVPLDVTMREVLEETDRSALFAAGTAVPEFVARATDFYFGGYGSDVYGRRASPAHDALAAAILTGDIVPVVFPTVDVVVDCTDGPGRGATIGDTRRRYRDFDDARGRTRVALQTDGSFPSVLVRTLVDYGERLASR